MRVDVVSGSRVAAAQEASEVKRAAESQPSELTVNFSLLPPFFWTDADSFFLQVSIDLSILQLQLRIDHKKVTERPL